MGLIERLTHRVEASSPEVGKKAFNFDDGFNYNVFGDDWSTTVSGSLAALLSGGVESYSAIYRSQSAVYTVVEFVATQASAVGMKVYRRRADADREEVRDGLLFDTIQRPAPGLTYKRLIHSIVADRMVFGNHYLRKVGSGNDRALVPLPAARVTPKGGNLLAAARYELSGTDGVALQVFDADEVVHFRRYNPDDARIGVSPLEPLRAVLQSDAAALAHWLNVWRNGARVGGWLRLPEGSELSTEAMNRLRESLKQAYSGSRNAGKMGILEGGADFLRDQWSPQESEFIEGRKLTLETVARALNVPLAVLSLTDTSTYASQKEFHKQLYVDTLGPIFKEIEEEFEASIVPWLTDEDDIYVEFNVEEKLRGSFEESAAALRQAVGVPTLSVNEGRALQNRPRIDDPEFDRPVMPSNVIYGEPGEAPMPEVRETPDLRAV